MISEFIMSRSSRSRHKFNKKDQLGLVIFNKNASSDDDKVVVIPFRSRSMTPIGSNRWQLLHTDQENGPGRYVVCFKKRERLLLLTENKTDYRPR